MHRPDRGDRDTQFIGGVSRYSRKERFSGHMTPLLGTAHVAVTGPSLVAEVGFRLAPCCLHEVD